MRIYPDPVLAAALEAEQTATRTTHIPGIGNAVWALLEKNHCPVPQQVGTDYAGNVEDYVE